MSQQDPKAVTAGKRRAKSPMAKKPTAADTLASVRSRSPRGSVAADSVAETGVEAAAKQPPHRPNWTVWNGRPLVSLYSAICLIHNITPGRKYVAKLRDAKDSRCKNFEGHLITIKQWQAMDMRLQSVPLSDQKPTDRTDVSLHEFIEFVRERNPFHGISIPAEFWALTPPKVPVHLPTSSPVPLPAHSPAPVARAVNAPEAAQRPHPTSSLADAKIIAPRRAEPVAADLPSPGQDVTVSVAKPLKHATAAGTPEATPVPAKRSRLDAILQREQRTINLDQPGYLSLRQVLSVFAVSRSTWYAGVKDGSFPKPEKLSVRKVGWRTEVIKALLDKKKR